MPSAAKKKPVRSARHTPIVNVTVRTKGRIALEHKRPAAKQGERGRVLIPIADAAHRLGLSIWTLRSWVYQGRISFHRVGPAGRVMIADAEIERVIAQTEVAATAA